MACLLLLFLVPQDQELKQLIEKVKTNEALYDNYDVEVIEKYRLVNKLPHQLRATLTSAEYCRQFSIYGKLARFEETNETSTLEGKNDTYHIFYSYDGKRTYLGEDRKIVSIKEEYEPPVHVIRPHTMLLKLARLPGPLSKWLTGGEELKNYPNAGLYKSFDMETSVIGKETINGEPCIRIRSKGNKDGKLLITRDVWLSAEKNYLPVKSSAILNAYSETIPLEICECTKFKKVGNNLWFPEQYTIKVNSEVEARKGLQTPSNESDFRVVKIEIAPKRSPEFFSSTKLSP